MAMVQNFCCLLLIVPLAHSASVSDTVNERIPVSRAALEAHWHLDCVAGWAKLAGAGARAPAEGHCGIPGGLRDELELCAFIYQTPGGSAEAGCRDYRGAVDVLDSMESGEICTRLVKFLAAQPHCPDTPPE